MIDASSPSAAHRRISSPLTRLWLPVLALAAVTFCLVRADSVAYAGVPIDLVDPLDGFTVVFIAAVCILAALVSVGVALSASFSSGAPRRERTALVNAVWSAVFAVAFTVFVATTARQEHKYQLSSTLNDALPWQGAAVVIGLVPRVVCLVVRRRDQ